MIVKHNITAMNANRMLGVTTGAQAKSTEKLSSGYKINRAADDAAGLAISEKMRRQVRGLTQASANAQDGISAVQTAEGALTEVHDMLQRMNELAVKSANGTESEDDRSKIQQEIDQLATEIDRVSETTKFNETYLLKGDKNATMDYRYGFKKVGTAAAATVAAVTDATTNMTATFTFEATADQNKQNELAKSLKSQGFSASVTSVWTTAEKEKYTFELNGAASKDYKVVATDDPQTTFEIQDKGGNKIASVVMSGKPTADFTSATSTNKTGGSVSASMSASTITGAKTAGQDAQYFDADGNKISANALNKYVAVTAAGAVKVRADAPAVYDAVGNKTTLDVANDIDKTKDLVGSLQIALHVGADATSENQITINLDAMSAKSLGINGIKVDGKDDTNARNAIETIKEALSKVSTQRADLGAVQNRLEHTINNLDNVVENTTSAEAAIRDTDIAKEMVQYANNNILQQAGTSMLSQANQSNQLALSLLG